MKRKLSADVAKLSLDSSFSDVEEDSDDACLGNEETKTVKRARKTQVNSSKFVNSGNSLGNSIKEKKKSKAADKQKKTTQATKIKKKNKENKFLQENDTTFDRKIFLDTNETQPNNADFVPLQENLTKTTSTNIQRRIYQQIPQHVQEKLDDPQYDISAITVQGKVLRQTMSVVSKCLGYVPIEFTEKGICLDGIATLQKDKEEGAKVKCNFLLSRNEWVFYNYRSPHKQFRKIFAQDIVMKHASDNQSQLLVWFLKDNKLSIQVWSSTSDVYDEVECDACDVKIPQWIPSDDTDLDTCRTIQVALSHFLIKTYLIKSRSEVAPLKIIIDNGRLILSQKKGRRYISVNEETEDGKKAPLLTQPIELSTCVYAYYYIVRALNDYNKNAFLVIDPQKPNTITFFVTLQGQEAGGRVVLEVNRNLPSGE